MIEPDSLIFPLEKVTDTQLDQLGCALWSWRFSCVCSSAQTCVSDECSRRRFARLKPFFNYYRELTATYIPGVLYIGAEQAIRCHEDVFEMIRLIKSRPDDPRSRLTKDHFSSRQKGVPPISDQHHAFNLAMRVLTMVYCCVEGQNVGNLEAGLDASMWNSITSATDFISSTFPAMEHPSLEDESSTHIKAQLSAINLRKVVGLSFIGTNDLRNHLKLDQKRGIVEIFHHTGFLKECLLASKKGNSTVIPRQLVLETLDSFQKILFPLDSKSQALLRSLVSKKAFDPDCLRFGSSAYRLEDENEVVYRYWGSRLMDLYDEIENPTPRGYVDIWLEKRSKARHVMLATMVGVIIAVVLGILGLAVGIFQSWVSYQAWKHPVDGTT
ncbi:hypothetical protein BJ166DRAFT_524140 [Pestalotiopsis sp. NC0098]|nr:hypothetical protein BJ166DRAFT_524140 [Pestalotiopsis sp. NC0098]